MTVPRLDYICMNNSLSTISNFIFLFLFSSKKYMTNKPYENLIYFVISWSSICVCIIKEKRNTEGFHVGTEEA